MEHSILPSIFCLPFAIAIRTLQKATMCNDAIKT
jgi:hypothetical protein